MLVTIVDPYGEEEKIYVEALQSDTVLQFSLTYKNTLYKNNGRLIGW